jgi:hypothetical protein
MKKFISRKAAAACLVAGMMGASSANALYINVVPVNSTVGIGGSVQVDVHVGDLTDQSAPSLGAYDLNVLFDAALLQYTNIVWGDQLDQAQLGSMTLLDDSAAASGQLNVFEVSYDDIAVLDSQQSGDFVLFSLFFTAAAAGESAIEVDVLALGDAQGNALSADQVTGASVTAVPVPAALPLLMSGLLLLAGRVRKMVRR